MARHPKLFLTHWAPVMAYALLIYVQSSGPAPEQLPAIAHLDKVLHAGGYAVLSALLFRAFGTSPLRDQVGLIASLSILFAGLYGIADELHQSFVPCRHADVADALADMAGSFLGAYLYWVCRLKKQAGAQSVPIDKPGRFL